MKKEPSIYFTPSGHIKENKLTINDSFQLPKLSNKTHKALGLSDNEVIDMYKEMLLQRRFEERAMQMYQKGYYGGFLHLYIGQEAISTGINKALKKDDDVITAYRDHGWGLVRGISPKKGMAELFGKSTGCSKGKGGSMHFVNVKDHFWGGYGIVGGHIPIGTGIAFANKYNGNKRVTICLLGDGAVDQGVFHESLNMAQLWKLPCIYVIENNGYAMGTASVRHSIGELYERAKGYRMKSIVLNGMSVLDVYDNMKKIVNAVRNDSLPYLVEIRTYRYRGHSMSDPQNYREKKELQQFQDMDPILTLQNYILNKKINTQDNLNDIEEGTQSEIMEAIEYAKDSPYPDTSELYEDVFSQTPTFHQ